MTVRPPAIPARSIRAMQRTAAIVGMAHISEPLAAELKRLSRQVDPGEERSAA